MKPFEENYAAWLAGTLSVEESRAFELELDQRQVSETELVEEKLTAFLRQRSSSPTLANADFFNHQIAERIKQEERSAPALRRLGWLGLPRLAWFGGLSLATALVLFLTIIPKKSETHSREAYIARVISARTADPNVFATALQSTNGQGDDMAVVWLDGLDYLPGPPSNVH